MDVNGTSLLNLLRWFQWQTGLPPDDAADLVQEAVVCCLSRLRQQYPDDPPEQLAARMTQALFRKVARDLWVDYLRACDVEREALCQYAATMHAQHLTEAEWTDYQAALEVLERMEPLWQEVLRQRVEGYSWEEIAQVTGKPVSTLACGLERALEKACAGLNYAREKPRQRCKKPAVPNGIIYEKPTQDATFDIVQKEQSKDVASQDGTDQHAGRTHRRKHGNVTPQPRRAGRTTRGGQDGSSTK